jgi:hypothetical protein
MANLVSAINEWESKKAYHQRVSGRAMDPEDERLILIQICPDALEAYLRKESTKWPTYHDVKYEIFDYIARTAPKKRTGALHELSQHTPPGLYEPAWEPHLHDEWQESEHFEVPQDQRELLASMISAVPDEHRETLAAVIKSSFQKKGKGKGKKGGGKGDERRQAGKGPGPDNKCHECGSEEHFKRDCPVHIAKMEAKGKGKKGGSKGKNSWPTYGQWRSSYPYPTKNEWAEWFPGKGGKDGKGSANSFTQSTALEALVAAGVGFCNTITEIPAVKKQTDGWCKMPRPKTWKKSVKFNEAIHVATTCNRFKALADNDI